MGQLKGTGTPQAGRAASPGPAAGHQGVLRACRFRIWLEQRVPRAFLALWPGLCTQHFRFSLGHLCGVFSDDSSAVRWFLYHLTLRTGHHLTLLLCAAMPLLRPVARSQLHTYHLSPDMSFPLAFSFLTSQRILPHLQGLSEAPTPPGNPSGFPVL